MIQLTGFGIYYHYVASDYSTGDNVREKIVRVELCSKNKLEVYKQKMNINNNMIIIFKRLLV